ncbi:MAG TPA: serine acetyltransferase [Deltaproteobacteria bacterium]|nr:serine acetyltransferase [Deltaproteobacteria bacterium]
MLEQRDKNAREFLYIVCNSYMRKFGFFIGYTTSLRSEPILPHGFNGIYISGGASVGRGCIIFPNVIIGSNTLPDSKGQGAPQIGDNCYIGAGATIIGKVTIGNNCRIGANTTVSQDVPDNCVVISQEPRILQKSDLDNTWTPFTY